MSIGPKLELRQGQSLVMTQQLQQSIKLLQCNALELREYVEQELEKNPFLNVEEPENPDANGPTDDDKPARAEENEPAATDFDEDSNSLSHAMSQGDSWDESSEVERDYLQSSSTSSSRGGDFDDDDTRGIDDNAAQGKTLREHLLEQLQLDIHDPAKRLIGAQLIDMVDDAGYIKDDLGAVATAFDIEVEEVQEVLALLQRFDPPGICARNLKECLSVQLRDKNRLDPAMQILLDNLHLIADSKFDELRKLCGVDKDDLKQMITEIRELNPKPGNHFLHEVTQAVEPDVFVRRLPDGNWHVELNMNNFPRVMVNKRYYKKISAETRNMQDKKYLSEQFGSANWLVRALEQRAETLLKVAGELVKQQDAFFRLGVRYMKPMTLKHIASETHYHESTISRVTNGKYLLCPRGTFELKYFFTSGLSRSEGVGEDVSSETVKHYIAELVEAETASTVLSDDDIVDKLKERNITVARRTVAKYREALGITSSPKRKRLKQQGL
ncbi:MAG: RNA polymerase factor sigma-54 [Rickettsiales bacterium]|nr:RNA polymerase factor sigma-54 [Rickettsiales bacterium]